MALKAFKALTAFRVFRETAHLCQFQRPVRDMRKNWTNVRRLNRTLKTAQEVTKRAEARKITCTRNGWRVCLKDGAAKRSCVCRECISCALYSKRFRSVAISRLD